MKSLFRFPLVAAAASLLFISALAQAQNAPANAPRYKDVVVDNPNAEADMKVVGDFLNALIVSADYTKAQSLVAPTYMGHGPALTDSANIEKTLKEWRTNDKTMRNRKISFVTQTFRVTVGPQKGDWVSLWGDCAFTDVATGKTALFPIQYTAKVADGKILGDRVYFDNLAVIQQLGYTVVPPVVAKK